ncbi:MAG: radical SAM protein [Bacteroidota bacterium]
MSFWKSSNKNIKYLSLDKSIVEEYNNIRSKEKRKYLCHAPFKSMTFFHTGDILACWYNKLFPLGHYPEDSVHDIWFSKRADTLRNYIKHNDLSYGCADCRKSFNSMNFYSSGAWRYDFLPESSGKYPASVDFQISNTCNLQCIMCNGEYSANVRANRENKEMYKNPYDDNFFKQITEFIPHLKEASFSGGEPFFAKEFSRVWDLIIKLNPRINISVTTNGNIYNEKVQSYLDALKFNISVSLDAVTEETYNKIRVNGNFNTVMKNIRIFSDYTKKKGTFFSVKICPMRQNWPELHELSKSLSEKNISFLYNTVFYPPYCSLWNLNSVKLDKIAAFLQSKSMPANTEVQRENAKRYNDMALQIKHWHKEAVKREEWKLESMSLTQLRDFFMKNVLDYINREASIKFEEKPARIKKVSDLIGKMIQDSPSERAAMMGMQYYSIAPVERLLAEIEIRDYEKNRDRFLQIGLMDC